MLVLTCYPLMSCYGIRAVGGAFREIGQDKVGSRSADSGQRFQNGAVQVEPALLAAAMIMLNSPLT